MLRYLLITLTVLMCSSPLVAQDKLWTLQECILYARQNSIAVKRAQNSIASAEISRREATHNRYPSLNATVSGGFQFGRTIDPVSNSFNNTTIGFNSYNLSSGVVLYNGNSINNQIQLTKLDVEAARLDADFISNNISLEIAVGYLNVLLAEEQLEIVRKRLEQSQEQLRQTDQLIQAGSLPENERLNSLSQIALDQQSIIDAENQVRIAYLGIQQSMLIDPTDAFRVTKPLVSIPSGFDPDQLSLQEIYTSAYNTQANMKANELRMQSAEVGVDVAKASFYPRLTFGGGISTNYSDVARQFTVEPAIVEQNVTINGEPFVFGIESFTQTALDYPYADQLSDNLGQNIGATLSIPIYNGYSSKLGTERARLNVINQELQNREAEQTLLSNIQTAITNARASKRSLEASQAAQEAAQAAFQNAQKQFELGAINSLDFATARLNLDQAQISVLRDRYSYIFNIKQIEFYQGKTITLD